MTTPEARRRHNEKYNSQLGANVASASKHLVRKMLHHYARLLGLHVCFRCGEEIQDWRQMSLDHVVDWRNTEEAPELFWDLNNLELSHKHCNMKAGAQGRRTDKSKVQKRREHNQRCARWRDQNRTKQREVGRRHYYKRIAQKGSPTPQQLAKIVEFFGENWQDQL